MAKLTSAQIRKIIKAHNIEATVKIPAGLKQAELEKFVESQGFKINHDEKSISKGGKKITLEQAEKLTAPKQKTALQKQKAQEKKEEKAVAQKKKERELKKEAVKKATKDMVPKTSVPKKVGSKPVPKKEEPKKEEPKKGKKKGDKVKFTEQAKEVQKKIVERKKKKELEARKPKRKQLGETQKPTGSAVVQPGKPEDLQIKKKGVIKNKKPKPQPKAEAPKKEKKEKKVIKIKKQEKKSKSPEERKEEYFKEFKTEFDKIMEKYEFRDKKSRQKFIEQGLMNDDGTLSRKTIEEYGPFIMLTFGGTTKNLGTTTVATATSKDKNKPQIFVEFSSDEAFKPVDRTLPKRDQKIRFPLKEKN